MNNASRAIRREKKDTLILQRVDGGGVDAERIQSTHEATNI